MSGFDWCLCGHWIADNIRNEIIPLLDGWHSSTGIKWRISLAFLPPSPENLTIYVPYWSTLEYHIMLRWGRKFRQRKRGTAVSTIKPTFLSIGPMGRGSRTSQTRQYRKVVSLNTGITYEASRKFEKEGLGGGLSSRLLVSGSGHR